MYVPFDTLPNDARVWVYQANKAFTAQEASFISEHAIQFINQWTRHGADLKGSFTIKYNQFLVIAVDERFANVSGCSIDASVHFVQELQKALSLDLLNKMNISFKDGAHINIVSLSQFKNYAAAQKITPDTIVFNNLVTTKEALLQQWEVPAKESWHQRFLIS